MTTRFSRKIRPDIFELPVPSAESAALSALLVSRIREVIVRESAITFQRFMEFALYEPELGYYRSGAAIFGSQGDFVTAPEISPLFGRCIATQCAAVLAAMGSGSVLEFGAGSGQLALDLLLALAKLNQLPENYLILETSKALRERQKQTIAALPEHLRSCVHWIAELPRKGFCGVILANEVLDAMPVRRFVNRAEALHEQTVSHRGNALNWSTQPADAGLQAAVAAIERDLGSPLPMDYCSEINSWLDPWFSALAETLRRGVVLIFDYGYPRREYYHPQRSDGTLQCHFRHRVHHDPFFYPGLQDMTASVDFTAVAESGQTAGLELMGYSPQARFLIGAGALEIGAQSAEDAKLAQEMKRLLMPDEMGERFQVMGFSKALRIKLSGFSQGDIRHRL